MHILWPHWYWLTRCVLAAWLVVVGASVASPLLRSVGLEQVCSAIGIARWAGYQDGPLSRSASYVLDCPLCVGTSALPVFWQRHNVLVVPLVGVGQSLSKAPFWVWRATAALPARGPPA